MPVRNKITIEEYLEIERAAPFKSEYYKGQMRPLHQDEKARNYFWKNPDTIQQNHQIILSALKSILLDVFYEDQYDIVSNDYQIFIGKKFRTVFDDALTSPFENPFLLFEIFSPSIKTYDFGKTFHLTRLNKTLKQYVNIYSEEIFLESYQRVSSNNWILSSYQSLDDHCKIETIEYDLSLSALYDELAF